MRGLRNGFEPDPFYFSKSEKWHKFDPPLRMNPQVAKCKKCGVIRSMMKSRFRRGVMVVTYLIDGKRNGKAPYCVNWRPSQQHKGDE